MTMTVQRTKQMIGSGQWWDGDLDESIEIAQEMWDAAGNDKGPWEMSVDVADYTKILTELRQRRREDIV